MSVRSVVGLPMAAAVLMLSGWSVQAQDVILEGVTVTTSKAEDDSPAAVRKKQIKKQVPLEGDVKTASKVEESAVDALSGSSAMGKSQLDEQFQATEASDILNTIPGVATSQTSSDTAQSVNIRGLQDFGRVNVLIEGARQNFQRSGHNANGSFYLEPEMIGSIDVTRGPTSMIYGSGAIGGVVAFNLLNADDILREGEYAAVQMKGSYGSNDDALLGSFTGAVRAGNFDILGQTNFRDSNDYTDGGGHVIADTGDETQSNMINARWRPANGHQVTATIIDYTSDFVDSMAGSSTRRDTDVQNNQYTLGYTFSRPDTPLLDFSAKVYRNDTNLDQVTIGSGSHRFFDIRTDGFDVNNTSRFASGPFRLALTYGGDSVYDEVATFDEDGYGSALTPGGKRTLEGAFLQSQLTMFEFVEVITAVRYDHYELESDAASSDGSRVSPKVTLGVTPITGITVFGTYAEGYRAPSTTETLIDGFHPFPAFPLLPNPDLRPEIAHNWEAGANLKYDSVFKSNDAFRAKVTGFRNEIDDYIDAVQTDVNGDDGNPSCYPPSSFTFPCLVDDAFQYVNIAKARIQGVELEASYDAKSWFAIVSAQHIIGKNVETGEKLVTVLPDRVVGTLGFRLLNDLLVAGTRVSLVDSHEGGNTGSGSVFPASDAYTLVDLFAQYQVNDHAVLNLNIDNLFDEEYLQYLDQENSPGFNARVGMTLRFGAR
jgi:hemoglobin/transferrin/lactoferrin receptor protein